MALAFACLSLFTFSCDDEVENKEKDAPRELRYASVSEVYEGKAMESAKPVVFSSGKTKFEITGATAEDGGIFIDGEFQIVDTTGVVKLKADNQLIAGTYYLDLKVSNSAGETVFPKAFEQIVLPSAIEGLQYTPLRQILVRGQDGQKTTVPVFKGTDPVTFALAEVSDFAIDDATGEISLSTNSQIDAGEYKLTVVTSNVAGEQTFPQVVIIDVQTLPYELVYSTRTYEGVQQNQAKQSVDASIKGTGPIAYSLKNDFGAFTINATSGQVSLPVNHNLAIDTYNLTVVATNIYGSVVFVNALSFEIIEIKSVLATDLTYGSATYSVNKAHAFATDMPTVSGSTPAYSLADSHGAFVIDETTGVISLAEGNGLAMGVYPLTVIATNNAGVAIFTDIITVTVEATSLGVVFEDGWQGLSSVSGESGLGNFTQVDLKNTGYQDSKLRWVNSWGLNAVLRNIYGDKAATAEMKSKKNADINTENDDWLVSGQIDLTNVTDPGVLIHIFQLYVWDATNNVPKRSDKVVIKISEDYAGDVSTAQWDVLYEFTPEEIYQEAFSDYALRIPRVFDYNTKNELSLKTYEGKVITIAIQSTSEDQSTGDVAIQKFQVLGIQ